MGKSDLRYVVVRSGDADHPAEVVGALPSGMLRVIPLSLADLAALVKDGSNILERIVREEASRCG